MQINSDANNQYGLLINNVDDEEQFKLNIDTNQHSDLFLYKDGTEKVAFRTYWPSIIRNDFFRRSLNDDLKFNFSKITWTFSSISSAYGAGILAAQLYDAPVKVSDILKGNSFVSA